MLLTPILLTILCSARLTPSVPISSVSISPISIPVVIEEIVNSETRSDSLRVISLIDHHRAPLPYFDAIQSASAQFKVPAPLIAAIIQEESGFNGWAERTERRYARNRRVRRGAHLWSRAHGGLPTARTELQDRARSMGPMQVMGEVARTQGFTEQYLSTLFDPHNSIAQGSLLMRHLLDRYPHDTLAAISAYNSGSARRHHGVCENARYVYRVAIAWRMYQKFFASLPVHQQH